MSVPPRDLRNHYGRLLARAEAGEQIDINDGPVIAILGPPRAPAGTPRAEVVEVFRDLNRSTATGSSMTCMETAAWMTPSAIPTGP